MSNKSVKEMMKIWLKDSKETESGNIPLNSGLVRKTAGGEHNKNLTGRGAESRVLVGRQDQEAERKGREVLTGTTTSLKGTGKLASIFDRKIGGVGRELDGERKENPARTCRKESSEEERPRADRSRKKGVSGCDEPRLRITDLIRNYNCLESAAKNTREMNRSQGENMNLLVRNQADRKKRKLEEDLNLLESSGHKRCKTPLTETESERDKNFVKQFKINPLLTRKEPAAGAVDGGGQGSHSLGVGEVIRRKSGSSPEAPARIGSVQPHSCSTASLLGERKFSQ